MYVSHLIFVFCIMNLSFSWFYSPSAVGASMKGWMDVRSNKNDLGLYCLPRPVYLYLFVLS